MAAVFDSIIKQGAVRLTLDIDEVGPFGETDICYERSKYAFYKENGDVLLTGRYNKASRKSIELGMGES